MAACLLVTLPLDLRPPFPPRHRAARPAAGGAGLLRGRPHLRAAHLPGRRPPAPVPGPAGGAAVIPEYSVASACGVVLTVLLEVLVLRTGLFRDPRYWVALAIVAAFQLLVNGVLTCPPIVSYDPDQILGPRIACAPIEDLGFGFAMVTTTIALWRRAGVRTPGGGGPW